MRGFRGVRAPAERGLRHTVAIGFLGVGGVLAAGIQGVDADSVVLELLWATSR